MGCSRQAEQAAAVVPKAAKAVAVGLAAVAAGLVVRAVTAGLVEEMVGWGSEVVATVGVEAVAGLEEERAVGGSAVEVTAATGAGDLAAEMEATGWVVVATGWVAEEEEASCAMRHRMCTRYRSKIQPCGCTEHQIQKRYIEYRFDHRASVT